MSGYDVNPSELFAAQAAVQDAAAQGRDELARLRAVAQDLLGGQWHGRAASAFGAGWQDWADGAQTVLAALDEMAHALGTTALDYERNENGVSLDLRSIA